jgi:hypothetical protein
MKLEILNFDGAYLIQINVMVTEGDGVAVIDSITDSVIGCFVGNFNETDLMRVLHEHWDDLSEGKIIGIEDRIDKLGYIDLEVRFDSCGDVVDETVRLEMMPVFSAKNTRPTHNEKNTDDHVVVDDNNGLLSCPESDDMPDNNDKDY